MPKTIADGRIALWALTEKPKDLGALTTAELGEGKKISCAILKSDYQLGATGDNTITETALCMPGEGQALGAATYSGTVTVFRELDPATGLADQTEDWAWDLFKERGTTLWLVEREGPLETAAPAEGQEYSIYEVQTGTPQKPSNRTEGYIKRTITLAVVRAVENQKLAA